MYSTCLFCHTRLARNAALEAFPVGRRLAYDPAKGRLWVVCRRCARWNLTPLEERWEAIEECERLYRGARLRAATDNIGLARLAEGLELVRVGKALRPEFAAWRYGRQLRRRHAEMAALVGTSAVVAGGIAVSVLNSPVLSAGALQVGVYAYAGAMLLRNSWQVLARVEANDGKRLDVRAYELRQTCLRGSPSGGWRLEIPAAGGVEELTGEPAVRAARLLLPWLNGAGGGRRQVADALAVVEDAGGPEGAWLRVIRKAGARPNAPLLVSTLPREARLALEMVANEEVERRALEGELAPLEQAWRDAEEIAAIADNMFLPPSIEDFIRRHRRQRTPSRRVDAPTAGPVPPTTPGRALPPVPETAARGSRFIWGAIPVAIALALVLLLAPVGAPPPEPDVPGITRPDTTAGAAVRDVPALYAPDVESSLRSLAKAQDRYYADSGTYTNQISMLIGFAPAEDVIVSVREAGKYGWSATATHARVGVTCSMYVGTTQDKGAAGEGVPACY